MITHSVKVPFVTHYWDYYILSRLHHDASMVLQRCEMWNATKEVGNIHNDALNEQMQKAGKRPTQDTSRWFYKSQEELAWELMGVTCEKKLSTRKKEVESDTFRILDFLIGDLGYVESRNNPDLLFDRRKQYRVNSKLLQQHVSYLSAIIEVFQVPLHHLTSIFYVIEALTQEKVYIDTLGLSQIVTRLFEMQTIVSEIDKLREIQAEHNKGLKRTDRDTTKHPYPYPVFVVNGLNKLNWDIIEEIQHNIPFRNFSEWKAKICGIEYEESRNANGKVSDCIPQIFGSNSRLLTDDTTEDTNKGQERDTHVASTSSSAHTVVSSSDENNALSSLSLEALQAEITRRTQSTMTHPEQASPIAASDETIGTNVDVVTPDASTTQPTLPNVQSEAKSADEDYGNKGTGKGKGTRKKSASLLDKLDEVTQKRVLDFYDALDILKKEVSGKSNVKYPRWDTNTQAIVDLLENEGPTVEGLRRVYMHLWNMKRDEKTGFLWQENMTVQAICRQYPTKIMVLMPKAKETPKVDPSKPVDLRQYESDLTRRLREREEQFKASQLVKG